MASSGNQPSCVDVYRGFCALHDVISYIVDTAPYVTDTHPAEVDVKETSDAGDRDSQVLPPRLKSAGRHVSTLVLPSFRREIMEDVFSLLFAQSEHLHDSEDSPDRQSCESEPENCNEDVSSPKRREFVFDAAGENANHDNSASVTDTAITAHELALADIPRVGMLMVESRSSPLEASSSSMDGRSDELSGSQTVSNSSVQCSSESGFLARDYVVRDILLLLNDCCKKLSTELFSEYNRSMKPGDQHAADLQLSRHVEALQEHVCDAQWRLRIVTLPGSVSTSRFSEHREPKRQQRRTRQCRDRVSLMESDTHPVTSHHSHMDTTVVSKMLCRPDSLLNLCLTEGRIAEAEEVVKVSHLSSEVQSFW